MHRDDLRSENPAPSATGDTERGEATSGAGVSLLFFVLQEVGRPVSRHPPPIHHLQGRVSTGVVHAAQRSVPAGRQRVSDQKHSALQPLCCAFRIECILTPYHREYSRARIMSSRMTRCHDTSSPAECWEKSNIIGL